jgi:hypothetical protein
LLRRPEPVSERVRPDARHYLLVNFHRLLVVPPIEAGRMSREEVLSHLVDDARKILGCARDLADSRDEGEISGHIAVDAVSEV